MERNDKLKNMIHNSPTNTQTLETDWWFLFDSESLKMVTEPQQCVGYTTSPYNMFIADSLEECEKYIETNAITNSLYEVMPADEEYIEPES
jgi:hypothetical protein